MKYWVSATGESPVVSEDDMLRKTINESSEPVVGRAVWELAKKVIERAVDVTTKG